MFLLHPLLLLHVYASNLLPLSRVVGLANRILDMSDVEVVVDGYRYRDVSWIILDARSRGGG